jgi:hypothetical protein
MMRPVSSPGVVVARFSDEDAERHFEIDDAVWAIGGKWEQQFMGHDGTTETLLPGVWLGAENRWDFKGWDGWQVPEPLRRCHGCHTVGLDVETGTFVEPNIGCESCHGPGSWHVDTLGLGRIHDGQDADVCGQCHSRGRTPDGEYFFPVGYRPGHDLDDYFHFDEPSPEQTSSSWWGNGSERRRHQELSAWRGGGHVDALRSLTDDYDGRYGAVNDDCLACHSVDYVLAPVRYKPSLAEAREGVTCAVCHNTHGDLDRPRMGCDGCHTEGPLYHEPVAREDHVPCPDWADVGCVDCHMPTTGSLGGDFVLHSHRPGIVEPAETEAWGMPSSCSSGGCHGGVEPAVLQGMFERFYGRPGLVADSHAAQPVGGG